MLSSFPAHLSLLQGQCPLRVRSQQLRSTQSAFLGIKETLQSQHILGTSAFEKVPGVTQKEGRSQALFSACCQLDWESMGQDPPLGFNLSPTLPPVPGAPRVSLVCVMFPDRTPGISWMEQRHTALADTPRNSRLKAIKPPRAAEQVEWLRLVIFLLGANACTILGVSQP